VTKLEDLSKKKMLDFLSRIPIGEERFWIQNYSEDREETATRTRRG